MRQACVGGFGFAVNPDRDQHLDACMHAANVHAWH